MPSPPLEARLALRVQASSRTAQVVWVADGVLRIRVAAPAKEGRGNQALVELLATKLRIPKAHIRVLHGLTSRSKVVAVQGLSQDEALRRLGGA